MIVYDVGNNLYSYEVDTSFDQTTLDNIVGDMEITGKLTTHDEVTHKDEVTHEKDSNHDNIQGNIINTKELYINSSPGTPYGNSRFISQRDDCSLKNNLVLYELGDASQNAEGPQRASLLITRVDTKGPEFSVQVQCEELGSVLSLPYSPNDKALFNCSLECDKTLEAKYTDLGSYDSNKKAVQRISRVSKDDNMPIVQIYELGNTGKDVNRASLELYRNALAEYSYYAMEIWNGSTSNLKIDYNGKLICNNIDNLYHFSVGGETLLGANSFANNPYPSVCTITKKDLNATVLTVIENLANSGATASSVWCRKAPSMQPAAIKIIDDTTAEIELNYDESIVCSSIKASQLK